MRIVGERRHTSVSTSVGYLKTDPAPATATRSASVFPNIRDIQPTRRAAKVTRAALEAIGEASEFGKFRVEHSFEVKVLPNAPD